MFPTIVPGNSENDKGFSAETFPIWEKCPYSLGVSCKYDLIDFELGSKITGAGFPIYKGKFKLKKLVQYFLDKNTAAGYTEFQVPH